MEEAFICTTLSHPQSYPQGAHVVAAVARADKTWRKSVLGVQFLDGPQELHDQVLAYAREWQRHCNISFVQVQSSGDIRITFREIGQYYSTVGTDAGHRQEHTMSLGFRSKASVDRSVVLHEFGHALGLLHEHQHPTERIPWNASAVYEYFMGPPIKWSREEVDRNVLNLEMGANTTSFDRDSIMLYALPKHLVNDPTWVYKWNTELSDGDKQMARSLYPFHIVPSDRDILCVKKTGTGTGTTEVHIMSASAGYRAWVLQTGTALHLTNENFDFCWARNRDLFIISKQGGSNSTEVHVLSSASNYKAFTLHTSTPLHQTGSTFAFCLAPNRDLFCIKKAATGTNQTEVHVLSAASNYQTFTLHTGTALHTTDDAWAFAIAPNRDLYCFKLQLCGTYSTEIHVLSAGSTYGQFSLQTGTALHVSSNDMFSFSVLPNSDVVCIKKNHTGTRSTEVHILSATSKYQAWNQQTGTCLHETDYTVKFLSLA